MCHKIICVFLFPLILFNLSSCSTGESWVEVHEALSKGAVVVDTRSLAEFEQGHLAGAILIPHDEMEQRFDELLTYRHEPIVLYCRSGRRSGIAKEILVRKGFSRVINGGSYAQLQAKLP